MKTVLAITMLFATLLVITSPHACAQQVSSIVITIGSDGIVYVEINGTVEVGVNSFECPVEPISATIEVLMDSEVAPAIYYNNSILVVSNDNRSARITYIANVTFENGRASFYYNSMREATLIVPPNILLLPENLTIMDAYLRDNRLFLRFKGPSTISFVVTEEADGQTLKPPSAPPTIIPAPLIGVEVALYVAIAVAAVVAIVAMKKKRGSRLATYLDEVDKAIIERLRKHGGEALQGLLYRELGLPKATVWRHVKKLEKMGYVSIERIGRDNKVRLLK
ncbi:MAG: winged helix-turn-helix transcriptional regulator [Candidatus Nezhaarchaeales archaeon]|nr:MAG: hypothetical protein DSO06_04670 [Candidatus Nezhaarchaeota archaeon WYZ-LMO8]TDA37098.1 MAG: hypothetical protein DSO05_01400 [Candidatus Nezhaarchaeota archaeon WYZ-LMO7]